MKGESTIHELAALAREKARLLDDNPGGFWVASMMAGAYVGMGILLIFSVGQTADPSFTLTVSGRRRTSGTQRASKTKTISTPYCGIWVSSSFPNRTSDSCTTRRSTLWTGGRVVGIYDFDDQSRLLQAIECG